ncbi:hypothetical protein RJT34_06769 [Clitoria ternatea]|uniref:F-box domain-containing protein n=1 Tax=Clitoria ternatea TaxID=43366 RepID=A0AAN9K5Y3_CLITE
MENKPTLPRDLIEQILLRLPVRFLLRSQIVCKEWYRLISDPQFAISHFKEAAEPTQRVLFWSSQFYMEFKDVHASLNDHSSVVCHRIPPPPPPPPPHSMACGRRIQYFNENANYEILGSCRGLLLLHCKPDLVLWNPSTGFYKWIQCLPLEFKEDIYMHGFGFHERTGDYHIVLIPFNYDKANSVKVFSFKGNSWSDVSGRNAWFGLYRRQLRKGLFANDRTLHSRQFRTGFLFNGTLHWLASFTLFEYDPYVCDCVHVIIAFDLMEMTLFDIPLPHRIAWKLNYVVCSLFRMGGCLSVSVYNWRKGNHEIWVMKEYNMGSSWIKSIVVPTHDYLFNPICVTKNGGILGFKIKNGILEKRNNKGKLLESLYTGRQCNITYVESLLSLQSAVKGTSNKGQQQHTRLLGYAIY